MINLLLGGPGGGKSYEAVAYHILPALIRGRKIITNLPLIIEALEVVHPGCTSLIEIREKTLAVEPVISEDRKSIPSAYFARQNIPTFSNRAFANPEDFASTWKHADGFGPLYVVDECHFCLPRGRTSIGVEEWFSMHRHYNCDVLLITQSSGKISAAIKDLVQVCYKLRKATAFGKPSGYIRKVLDGVNGGEISCQDRTYEKKYFGLYRSHTQGTAIAEKDADDVTPFIVKFRRFSLAFYAFTAICIGWVFWPSEPKKPLVVHKPSTDLIARAQAYELALQRGEKPSPYIYEKEGVQTVNSLPPAAAGLPLAPASAASASESVAIPEPFQGKQISLTGWLRMGERIVHTFAISSGGFRLFELQEKELISAGYKFRPLGECSGLLTFASKTVSLICDAPTVASGRNTAPLVMALNAKNEVVTSR